MKGTENEGFEPGEDRSRGSEDSGLEMKEHVSNNDMSVTLPNSEREREEKGGTDLRHVNPAVRWNLKTRAFINRFLFGESKTSKFFWLIFINGCAMAILALSIIHHTGEIDWCDGVGFLWIMYLIFYLGILYALARRFLGQHMDNFIKQVSSSCSCLLANKYFRWFCYVAPVTAVGIFVILSPGKSGRRIYSFLGMVIFIVFGFLFSRHPGHIKWRPVISGLVLQFLFGLIVIRVEIGKNILDCLGKKVTNFLQYTEAGGIFVYGHLAKSEENEAPIFAFTVLPVIFFLCFFINMLSYYGSLQWFILKISWIVEKIMGTTVCESVNAAASIFLGMTEAPLLIQPYLKDLTKSEMCAIMCEGWATVAGVVLAAYIKSGVKASHIIAASIMSAPAALSFSKLFYPETEESKNTVSRIVLTKEEGTNVLDAASKGALKALMVIGGITSNIIAFLAFVAFLDGTVSWIGSMIGFEELSFQYILSKIFYPVTFLMGVDENSLEDVSYLVGIKTVANEFQAYEMLGKLIKENKISERSEIIATYALCGFSNFGSIGITIGAISAIEPRQLSNASEVALRAFIAANIVCFLTACVAGCLID